MAFPTTCRARAWLTGAMLVAAALQPSVALAQADRTRPAAVDLGSRLAEARADARLSEALQRTGRKVAAFCANCHGESGNSVKPEVPNLAGQNAAYLLEQARQFSDGRRRNEFMESLIKAMSGDEKVGMALFYAAQPVQPQPDGPPALAARGRDLYERLCARCHGGNGHGNDKIARIAGQQGAYLLQTLRRYREGGGGVRTDPLMASNTRLLADADIEALVAHVAALR